MNPTKSQKFIQKAIKVHGTKYDYSQISYINHSTPVKIICPSHGPFMQRPTYHIQRASGCPKCYRDSQKYSEETFLAKAKEKFGEQFKYGQYIGFRKPIEIICKRHGLFISTPSNHLIQNGSCKQCLVENLQVPLQAWIDRFNNYHNNKYDYSQVTKDLRSYKKITVICPSHGSFYPIPSNHVRGHGCPKCACRNYVGGYSEQYFKINPHKKNELGISYIIRLWNDNEEFYKVGVTNRSVKKRFESVLPYNYEIIEETKMSLYEAHAEEVKTLKSHKRYTPQLNFPGWTECFRF